jgi:membrane-associated protein
MVSFPNFRNRMMAFFRQFRGKRWMRCGACGLAGWLALAVLLTTASPALAEDASATGDQPNFYLQIVQNLFNSEGLMRTLGQPEYTLAAFIALNVIVFMETGLLVGFCLPGDSLLVTAGLVAANPDCGWNLPLLLATLSLSAIIGDSVGYTIGFKTGPKIFCREKSWFFNKDHLLKAQRFYEQHGGKTIILARFMPILRTFAPVVAGVGKMNYRQFVFFNIFGGIGWVCSMILCGYFLPTLLNPALRPIFGDSFAVEKHVEKVVIIVVLVSIAPGILMWVKNKLAGKKEETLPVATPEKEMAKLVG